MLSRVRTVILKGIQKALCMVGIHLAVISASVSCQAATGPSEAGALQVEGTKLMKMHSKNFMKIGMQM